MRSNQCSVSLMDFSRDIEVAHQASNKHACHMPRTKQKQESRV